MPPHHGGAEDHTTVVTVVRLHHGKKTLPFTPRAPHLAGRADEAHTTSEAAPPWCRRTSQRARSHQRGAGASAAHTSGAGGLVWYEHHRGVADTNGAGVKINTSWC